MQTDSSRHANKFLPALGVCLGRFDGSPVRGAGMFEHVVATMKRAGLLKGKYAHLVGKAELKYVNYAAAPKGGGSEPEPDGAGSSWASPGCRALGCMPSGLCAATASCRRNACVVKLAKRRDLADTS